MFLSPLMWRIKGLRARDKSRILKCNNFWCISHPSLTGKASSYSSQHLGRSWPWKYTIAHIIFSVRSAKRVKAQRGCNKIRCPANQYQSPSGPCNYRQIQKLTTTTGKYITTVMDQNMKIIPLHELNCSPVYIFIRTLNYHATSLRLFLAK